MRKYYCLLTLLLALNSTCSDKDLVGIELFYEPPVYFAGYINGSYDSLTGNFWYQNKCDLVGDTIRMFFYSKEFSEENRIREGDFMRMDIYPGSDSALGRSKILFHMARYHGGNASYTVSPIDTLYGFDKIQFQVRTLERRHGGTVHLVNMSVYAGVIPGTSGEELEIIRGTLLGKVK